MRRRPVRLGLVQLACIAGEPALNALRSVAAIAEAVADGAGLVVLPELASTGYLLDRDRLAGAAESFAQPGPNLTAWSAAAREHRVAVVGGFVERDGDRLFNSVAVIGEDGDWVGCYRKLHLFSGEIGVFTPGDRGLPVFEVAGLRVGVLVCYDLRFPEALRILALQGAEVIAVPTAWVGGFDREVPDHGFIGQVEGALVQSNLSQVYVACADQVGEIDGVRLLGRSLLCNPYGRADVGPLSAERQEVVVVEIDPGEVVAARHRGPGIHPYENRRTDVYGELLGYQPKPALAAKRAQP